MRCTRIAKYTGRKNYAKNRHLRTIAQLRRAVSSLLRHASTVRKTCKQQYLGWWVWGTPANFSGFHVLAVLLHQCRWMEVNQTLHDVWLSPGLVHYVHIFGGSCCLMEFCQVHNSLCVQVLRSPILAALLHGTRSGHEPYFVAWYKEWSYGTYAPHRFQQRAPPIFPGWPSCWA